MGLDLSLRATAAVVLRPSWQPGDWDVPTHVVGYELKSPTPRTQVERIAVIAKELVGFAVLHGVTHVWAENYAFGLAGRSGMVLAELGGAVKFLFYESEGIVVEPVSVSTVRKYLLGKLPRKNQAAAVYDVLSSVGCPAAWTSDQKDALVVANYGRTELGLLGMTVANADTTHISTADRK